MGWTGCSPQRVSLQGLALEPEKQQWIATEDRSTRTLRRLASTSARTFPPRWDWRGWQDRFPSEDQASGADRHVREVATLHRRDGGVSERPFRQPDAAARREGGSGVRQLHPESGRRRPARQLGGLCSHSCQLSCAQACPLSRRAVASTRWRSSRYELEQDRGMIEGPARGLRHDTDEPEFGKIDRVHEGIDRANRVVLRRPSRPSTRETASSGCDQSRQHSVPSESPAAIEESYHRPRFHTARTQSCRSINRIWRSGQRESRPSVGWSQNEVDRVARLAA
jgi:hypothetical protein